jgi:hypothetical protein
MKKSALIVALLIVAAFAKAEAGPPPKLIVHEWGTFTNFAGADGVYLDYRPLVGSDLPNFVFDRSGQTLLTERIKLASAFSKSRLVTRIRMETPVTYFYTDQPMVVEAQVDFPRGLLTEFYPPGISMAPMALPGEESPPIGKSYLYWGQLRLTPQNSPMTPPSQIPPVDKGNPYAAARQTDSDIVRTINAFGNFDEKFLFYRGVGNFDLPVKMQSIRRFSSRFMKAAFASPTSVRWPTTPRSSCPPKPARWMNWAMRWPTIWSPKACTPKKHGPW